MSGLVGGIKSVELCIPHSFEAAKRLVDGQVTNSRDGKVEKKKDLPYQERVNHTAETLVKTLMLLKRNDAARITAMAELLAAQFFNNA